MYPVAGYGLFVASSRSLDNSYSLPCSRLRVVHGYESNSINDDIIFTAYPVAGYELNLNDDIIIRTAYPVAGYGSFMAASRV